MGVISPQCKAAQVAKQFTGRIEDHPRYKDASELSYRGLHYRLVKLYGKADRCENIKCEHKDYHRFEWACLDGEYTLVRSSWAMLCVYCHRQLDKQKITPILI